MAEGASEPVLSTGEARGDLPVEGPPADPDAAAEASGGGLAGLWRRWLVERWNAIHAEAQEEARDRADAAGARVSAWPLAVLLTAAVSLTVLQVLGQRMGLAHWVPALRRHPDYQLYNLAYWVVFCVVGYALIPGLLISLWPGERLRDYGLSTRDYLRHLWIYLALFAAVAPLVVVASFGEGFQHTYPFYDGAGKSWRRLLCWELLYGTQFLVLEFFFRGFLLFGLKRHFGAYAIFVMVVPYCMIHFSKPPSEIVGSIFAGVILGTLALRTRSIWGGVTIHVLVAVSMDLLALWHTNRLPRVF